VQQMQNPDSSGWRADATIQTAPLKRFAGTAGALARKRAAGAQSFASCF
jgi:hypothetical protein